MGRLFTNLKKRVAILTILCMMLTLAPSPAFAATASDISGHWAEGTIQSWVDNGLIKGYPDGTFKPDNNITRAEFITLVNGAFGYTETAPINFTDVDQNAWYASAIAVAVEAGYISGYPDGTMRPDNPISREEAATIIMKINKLEANLSAANTFTDAASLTWSKGAVGAVFAAGLMIGYPDGSFGPQKLIKRGEATVALDRAMKYVAGSVTPLAPSVTRNDDTNTVSGMTTAMEYKLDSANYATYVASAFNALDFSGNHTLLVRFAALGINPFGPATTLTFTTNIGGGGGGGNGGGSHDTAVSAITVTGTGSAITITTDNGTLQMLAAVEPTDATDKTVTWSVTNGTGSATISAGGLLTAVTNGTVTVKATSVSTGTIIGEKVITITITNPTVTLEQATATGAFDNTANINEMMTALWADEDSTVQGIAIKPVFSFADGELTVNGENVTTGLQQWILTQWGGSSVPVAISFSSGTPEDMTTDANWKNDYTVWVDLGSLVAGTETVDVAMTNGTTPSYDVTVTIPTVTLEQATATGAFDNTANINEMMTALWADGDSTVQGIAIKPVFSFADGELTVNGENVTTGLQQWILTQWGGSSVPVAISFSSGTPEDMTTDANWNNDYTVWVDLGSLVAGTETVDVAMTNGTTPSYDVTVTIPTVTLEQATATGAFDNTANINEMMTALWATGDSTVQGIAIKPVFSFADGELTVNGDNVSAGLLQWILTQWGGSSVPVAMSLSSGMPEDMTTDANWNNDCTVWVDLGSLVSGTETVPVAMTNGTTPSYDVRITITNPTVTLEQATATGAFDNTANINEMMTALWADGDSTVQGIAIKPVFSFADGELTVNGNNVTAGLLQWILTQWGGSSVPVAISFSSGTPEDMTTDANWNNDYTVWVDLGSLVAGTETVDVSMTNGTTPSYDVTATTALEDAAAIAAINAGSATLLNYTDAGITGVREGNLADVNIAVAAAKAANGSADLTRSEIQTVIYKGAIAAINAGEATLQNYIDARISYVTADNLAAVNTAVAAAKVTKGSDLIKSEIQGAVNGVAAAIVAINAGEATVQNYTDAGITGVTSDNLTKVNTAVVAARVANGSADLTRSEIQAVVDKGAAIKAINSGTATLQKYTVAEINGVTSDNLNDVNAAITEARAAKGSDLTKEQIQTVVDGVLPG